MRKTMLMVFAVIIAAPPAYAQNTTAEYYLIFGNRDGSPIDVYIDSDIQIEVWAATPWNHCCIDIDHNGIIDSINYMHIPLASDNNYITSRDGGELYFPLDQWDDVCFLPPDTSILPGYISQSILAFAYLWDPYNTLFNTNGDTVLIAVFFMHTRSDSAYLDQLVCPFMEGFNPANGGLLWGMQDGVIPIIPQQTFGCLYFVDYIAGDANNSGEVNGLDVIYLVNYLKGLGQPPEPIFAGDANGDCLANGLDVIYLVAYFKGGPGPSYGDCY